jgi:hypothetical protein
MNFKLPRFDSKYPVFKPAAMRLNTVSVILEQLMRSKTGSMEGAEFAGASPKGILSGPQIQSLWGRANPDLRSVAHQMAMKALGESSGDPRAVGHDPGGSIGYGLWQITSPFNRDLIAKYGGVNAMFNPIRNAMAAGDVFRRQGIGAWYAPSIPFMKGGVMARANGGGVAAGHPYLVGERGRELFVPDRNGSIVPNHALGGKEYAIVDLDNAKVTIRSQAGLEVDHNAAFVRQKERMHR